MARCQQAIEAAAGAGSSPHGQLGRQAARQGQGQLPQSGQRQQARPGLRQPGRREQEGEAWCPVAQEVVYDACARAAALRAEGVEVEMACSFIEVGLWACTCCIEPQQLRRFEFEPVAAAWQSAAHTNPTYAQTPHTTDLPGHDP